jgi:hypothetical protein
MTNMTRGWMLLPLLLAWATQVSAQVPQRPLLRSPPPQEEYRTTTLFVGPTTAAGGPWAVGAAFGGGLGRADEQRLAWELEFAASPERSRPGAASVGSIAGNAVMSVPVRGRLLYGTVGVGAWAESTGDTNFGAISLNMGGGAKIGLTDRTWLRLDYRAFLADVQGAADRRRRLYAGVHVAFRR